MLKSARAIFAKYQCINTLCFSSKDDIISHSYYAI